MICPCGLLHYIDHAAWLYTRIPQQNSGLTPLEIATSNKIGHKDLLCTRVWGCPCYMLDPKLQKNKRLPKCNRRARMGQFLDFLGYHSSTVALVRNLHTGFISPQYHVVFDDKFETVFSGSMSAEELDKICQRSFGGDRENYAEEEFMTMDF